MQNIEHPIIREIEKSGYPYSYENVKYPRCPICNEETSAFYRNIETGDIVGCNCCVKEIDAWETQEPE